MFLLFTVCMFYICLPLLSRVLVLTANFTIRTTRIKIICTAPNDQLLCALLPLHSMLFYFMTTQSIILVLIKITLNFDIFY